VLEIGTSAASCVEEDGHGRRLHGHQVELSVAVQVADRDRPRTPAVLGRSGSVVAPFPKTAVGAVEENGDVMAVDPDRDVGTAVSVQIADGDRTEA